MQSMLHDYNIIDIVKRRETKQQRMKKKKKWLNNEVIYQN